MRKVQRLTAIATLSLVALAPAVTAGAAGDDGDRDRDRTEAKRQHDRQRPATEVVGIHDNYYDPTKLKIAKGTKVVWKWPRIPGDSHDVTLVDGPKGVKSFQSPIAASDFRFKHRFTKRGTYQIVCTLHTSMRMKIVVRR